MVYEIKKKIMSVPLPVPPDEDLRIQIDYVHNLYGLVHLDPNNPKDQAACRCITRYVEITWSKERQWVSLEEAADCLQATMRGMRNLVERQAERPKETRVLEPGQDFVRVKQGRTLRYILTMHGFRTLCMVARNPNADVIKRVLIAMESFMEKQFMSM